MALALLSDTVRGLIFRLGRIFRERRGYAGIFKQSDRADNNSGNRISCYGYRRAFPAGKAQRRNTRHADRQLSFMGRAVRAYEQSRGSALERSRSSQEHSLQPQNYLQGY